MPAICQAIGRLRYTVGHAPDLCFERMVRAGLVPRFEQRLVSDVVYGDHRGYQLTLAMVYLWPRQSERPSEADYSSAFQGLAIAIRWPGEPAMLPCDQLTRLIDGQDYAKLTWVDQHLMLTIPCGSNPFSLGNPFDSPAHTSEMLTRVAAAMQIPHRLIDLLLEQAPERVRRT
jgi:hypothetical protein